MPVRGPVLPSATLTGTPIHAPRKPAARIPLLAAQVLSGRSAASLLTVERAPETVAGTPTDRAGASLRDGARLVPATPGREAVAAALRVATPVLGLERRRPDGVTGTAVPAGVALAIANGPFRAAALLPGTGGDRAGQAPAVGQALRGRSRVPADANAVMDAVVIARPETDGRAIVPGEGVTTPRRAGVEDVAPAPAELRIATSGMGRVVEAGPSTKEGQDVAEARRPGRVRAPIGDAPPGVLRVVAARPSPAPYAAPSRAVAIGDAGAREGRPQDGLVTELPIPRKVGAIPDVAGVTTSVLAPAEVSGARPAGGDVAPVRGPVTPVPRPPLVLALGLGPMAMGRLDEGGHALLEAVLAMPSLAPAARREVDTEPTPRLRMVIRLSRTAGETGVDVLRPSIQATASPAITARAAQAGRPRPAMVEAPREAHGQGRRQIRAVVRVARIAIRGAPSPGLVAGTPCGAVAVAPMVVPAGTMAIARATVGAPVGATLRRARAGSG